jgi:hypothetical protein
MQKLTESKLSEDMRSLGLAASAGSLVLTLLWVACMIALSGQETAALQLAAHPMLFRVNFAACTLLTLVQVPLAVALAALAWERCPVRALTGGALVLAYVPLNVSCYFLNGAVLPRLLGEHPVLASAVDMLSPVSLFGSLDVLGYGILGLGWTAIATVLVGRSRLWAVAAALMIMCGLACVLGALGQFVDVPVLAHGSMAGGMIAVLVYAVLIPAFRQAPSS